MHASDILPIILAVSIPLLVRADVPRVDFDAMGKVALAGSFAGLDVASANQALSFDPSTSTLVSRAANGSVSTVGATNQGGSITSACVLDNKLYIAGNFSSIHDTSAANIASYDISSRSFAALGSGLDGRVQSIHCDSSTGKLWVGGDFHAPVNADSSKYGGSAAVYDTKASSWSPVPFFGLTGGSSPVVNSIIPSSSGSSLYFAGSFLTSFAGSSNTTIPVNGTNNPNVPYSSGATPYSSSLVPVPLTNADVNANPTSTVQGFSDVHNILCPTGDDGPGQSWYSTDGHPTLITVRTNRFNGVRGVRIGNTFTGNRGTTQFHFVSIPQNNVLQLTYIDPTTKANATCTNNCPLLSDPAVPYQDFLFDESTDLTGFQLVLSAWNGRGAGLHLLQLLSDGAFASSIPDNNAKSCFAPNASAVLPSGNWRVVQTDTNIPGTTQTVRVASVAVGTNSDAAPSMTWFPYVSASGVYNVYVYVPGCTSMQDCASRTSVKVIVKPGDGSADVTKVISERVESDTRQLVYSGVIVPSIPAFTSTVKLALADQPEGTGQNGQYDIVADRVQFQLVSPLINGSIPSGGQTGTGGNGTTGVSTQGFGLFEWTTSNTTFLNATGIISNSSESSIDTLSTKFASALGTTISLASVNALAPSSDNLIFVGGSFSIVNGPSNVAVFKDGSIIALANNGLNGVVTSLAMANGSLFVGGSFTDTASDHVVGLGGVARYDVAANSWNALGGGTNGVIVSVVVSQGSVTLVGNFTEVYSAPGGYGSPVGGVATWDVAGRKWASTSGLLIGSATFALPASSSGSEYIAGNIAAVSGFSAGGWSLINTDKNGQISFSSSAAPLDNVAASSSSSQSSSAPSPSASASLTRRRRARSRRSAGGAMSWFMPHIRAAAAAFPRQSSSSTPTSLPTPAPAPAPAVLTGTFWTNTTSSRELFILGGNFSFIPTNGTSRSQGVALYDPEDGSLAALQQGSDQSQTIEGVVRALLVSESVLFVGGNFTLGSGGSGLGVYDLVQRKWQPSGQALTASSGSSVVVRSLTTRPSDSSVIVVGGTFAAAGSLPCNAICLWSSKDQQWSSLGNGIKGEVSSIDYASDNGDVLIAAGSLTLDDGTPANVAKYFFGNSSWAAVGSGSEIPGPVTAVRINDQNLSSIFAAGRSSDGTSSFILHWNGVSWTPLANNSFDGSSTVSQLEFVPLQDDHSANSIIQNDRMLMISGTLASSSLGNVSAALYDGQTFYPYITSTTVSGSPGLIAGLFHSFISVKFNARHFLATGVVILISIAIAAGIVFLLLLIGVVWTLLARDKPLGLAKDDDEGEDDDSYRHPSSLLEHVNAATSGVILGGAAARGGGGGESDDYHGMSHLSHEQHAENVDGSGWRRSETPGVLAGAGIGDTSYEQTDEEGGPYEPRVAHARFSFDGMNEGEISLTSGTEVSVINDSDRQWWLVRDERTGMEGVVPASYLY